jgi:SAM-dependent methyltransferase
MLSPKELLLTYKLIAESNIKLLQKGVRNNPNISVFKDIESCVIFLDTFVDEESSYSNANWISQNSNFMSKDGSERLADNTRRIESFINLIKGKSVLDFGCGDGFFLKSIAKEAASVTGVELNRTSCGELNSYGIPAYSNAMSIPSDSIDSCFLFHSFHYMVDPVGVLCEINRLLKPGGSLVIEVPNARDFLISVLQNQDFQKFSFSAESMILHTVESLETFFVKAGLRVAQSHCTQRYGLANHLQWLSSGKPGGHKGALAKLFNHRVEKMYSDALCKAGLGDTLICHGVKDC